MERSYRALGGVLLALALTAGAAGVSGAVAGAPGVLPNPNADNSAPVIPAGVGVARVHVWLARALSARLNALTAETLAVAAAHDLTVQDRAALDTIIRADQAGLAGLSTALASETTIAQLQASADAMVLDYRVFSLLTPQVRGVVLTDRALAKVATLTALEPSIQTAITTEQRTGRGAAAQQIYERLVGQLSAVETSLEGSSAALLALTPQDDSSAPQAFATAEAAIGAASSQLVTARTEVRRIVELLGGA